MPQDKADSPEAQNSRRRLIYVTERIRIIAEELASLKSEREALRAAAPGKDAGN